MPDLKWYTRITAPKADTYRVVNHRDEPIVNFGMSLARARAFALAHNRALRGIATPRAQRITSKAICLMLFPKFKGDRDTFVAAAQTQGVKRITAITYYDDIRAGRIAA